jgi:predicted nucleotidyltransferase
LSTEQVAAALANHPDIQLAIVFGSVAQGSAKRESDVDVAIQAARPMNAEEKLQLIGQLAAATGRPVDLIDLRTVGEPLLGQILKHGKMIRGSAADKARLMQQHVYAMEDFMPYVERTLAERRRTWIG